MPAWYAAAENGGRWVWGDARLPHRCWRLTLDQPDVPATFHDGHTEVGCDDCRQPVHRDGFRLWGESMTNRRTYRGDGGG